MIKTRITVQNQVGLHARPADYFIRVANCFQSSIWIIRKERTVNAKSLLPILALAIVGGADIELKADGPDEQEAIKILTALIQCGFKKNEAEKILESATQYRRTWQDEKQAHT